MQKAMSVEELSNKLKPLFGKKIDELYFRYSVANSLEERNEIFQVLTSLYQKHLSKLLDEQVLLSPPAKEIVLGAQKLNGRYVLPEGDFDGIVDELMIFKRCLDTAEIKEIYEAGLPASK